MKQTEYITVTMFRCHVPNKTLKATGTLRIRANLSKIKPHCMFDLRFKPNMILQAKISLENKQNSCVQLEDYYTRHLNSLTHHT